MSFMSVGETWFHYGFMLGFENILDVFQKSWANKTISFLSCIGVKSILDGYEILMFAPLAPTTGLARQYVEGKNSFISSKLT